MDETSQVPRKELLHVHKVSDCARFFPCKPVRHGTMLPSLQRKEIGTSELDPFRSSILGPRSPLRTLHGCPREQNLVHHSGSGRLARPSPWGTFTSYSLPAFLAHSVVGLVSRVLPVHTAARN